MATSRGDSVLTFDEACSYLKISRDKLSQLIQQEQLPAVKFQRLWRIPRNALDAWLTDKAEQAAASRPKSTR